MKVMVVGLKTYSFENSEKQKIEGAKISYLTPFASSKNNEIGYLPLQVTTTLDMARGLKEIPGLYEVKHEIVPGKGNKPEVVITGFDFLNSVDYLGLFD